jgi:hypothetical protein
LALGVLTAAAMAGGPVVVAKEPPTVVEEQAGTSGGNLPPVLVGIALCGAHCDDSDYDRGHRERPADPEPPVDPVIPANV